jgi:hypothetical protein
MSLRLLTCVLAFLATAGVALAACAVATGEIQGGEVLFGVDSGKGSGDMDTGNVELPDVGTVTWTDLYDSYFGPSAPASCTAVANGCHLSLGDLGAQGSGYVCGATKDSCWSGITSSAIPNSFLPPVPMGGSTSPTSTILFKSLHPLNVSTAGQMPLSAADGGAGYEFTTLDFARIAAWIDQGAAND